MAQQNISQGRPPIVWSTIDESFQRINANFTELYLSIGGTGVDLSNIAAALIPDSDELRDLGSPSRKWKDLYLSGSSLYLGSSVISSDPITGAINLPAGSTIDGTSIKEPSFQIIKVLGQSDVIADNSSSIVNFLGNGISIITNPSTDTVIFNNSGVTQISTGTGISIDNGTGLVQITNSGVTGLTVSGIGLSLSSATGNISISNTGVTQIIAGSGINIDTSTGVITITNSSQNIAQPVFRFISVDTQPSLDPSGPNSTLTLINGNGISITTNDLNNSVTISNNGVTSISTDGSIIASGGTGSISVSLPSTIVRNLQGDVLGSVFSDGSTMMIDGTEGKIIGPVDTNQLRTSESEIRLGVMYDFAPPLSGPASYTVAVGAFAGEIRQDSNAIAIGYIAANEDQGDHAIAVGVNSGGQRQASFAAAFGVEAGYRDQGARALALGYQAGAFNQGVEAVAIGKGAGHTNQAANSVIINASGVNLNGSAAGFYVAPVRNQSGTSGVVQYDATTSEITYSSALGSVSGSFTGNIFTSLIDSSDSSAITVTPLTIFSSDVVVENDLSVTQRLSVQGSRVLNLADLKSVVAASSSFADFQTRIAALV